MNNKEIFFWNKFKRWHLNDIEKAIKADANVGAAKLICCALDALAGFRFGATKYEGSKSRFLSFVKEFMPAFKRRLKLKSGGIILYRRSVLEMFYNNFRSGLVHEGLPGIGTEIIKDKNKNLLYITPTPDLLQINILGLFEYLKVTFDTYDKRLKSERKIQENFYKRLKHITNPALISIMR